MIEINGGSDWLSLRLGQDVWIMKRSGRRWPIVIRHAAELISGIVSCFASRGI